jgi:deoxyribodipyrimidine photolyase-related protein
MGNVSVWVLADQLSARHPALAAARSASGGSLPSVVLIEPSIGGEAYPFHRKRQVLVVSALRHYAASLRREGYSVAYYTGTDPLALLRRHCQVQSPTALVTMAASVYGTRQLQLSLGNRLGLPVTVLPNTLFLGGRFEPLPDRDPGQRTVMATFYRGMRRHFAFLLDGNGKPLGGKWSFDALNRRPFRGEVPVPNVAVFEPDAMTQQVMAEVEAEGNGAGSAHGFSLAVTRRQALVALADFIDHRLHSFGTYEDAMSQRHATLFHSVLSPYLNLGLLDPLEVAQAAEDRYRAGAVPLNSAEGFVRQVIGWREFIYWQYWRRMPGLAQTNHWEAHRQLPGFFWTGQTTMNCMRHVFNRALRLGYNHHIERLMLICNFCQLSGIAPPAVNDWFMRHYVDAYEWVMVPNVLGMGLYADGGLTATKPYIASANYIRRMSDYCEACAYEPRRRTGRGACPYNFLYWDFLIRHEATLRANPRLGPAVLGLRHLTSAERDLVKEDALRYLARVAPEGD